jgi:hypothetical protein
MAETGFVEPQAMENPCLGERIARYDIIDKLEIRLNRSG